MANQPELVQYDDGVYQLEVADPVQGGVGGVSNKALLNLANRTTYLKKHLDDLEAGNTVPTGVATVNSPTFTGDPKAPTPALGDKDTSLATTAFVQNTVNGVLTKNVGGGVNVTLTAVEAGNGILVFSGALTANIAVIVPAVSKQWIVDNNTTGPYSLTVKTASGAGVECSQTKNIELFCDGTNVQMSTTDFVSPAMTGTPTAPTAAPGTNTTQLATTEFATGAVSALQGTSVQKDSNTGAAALPVGTNAQRPANSAGRLRFNSDTSRFEGNNGSAWGSLGGATGGGNDAVFYQNDQVVNNDYTIPGGQNAMSAGPITIANGKTVTVSNGSVWTVV